MITLLIALILFVGAYSGYKSGIVLQLLKTIGYLVVLNLALDYYIPLSEYLYLFIPYPTPFFPESNPYLFFDERFMLTLDQSYYYFISFLLILILGWAVVRFFAQLLSYAIAEMKVPALLSGIGGSILGIVVNYGGIFCFLFLLSLIPYDLIQNRLADSFLADQILTASPVLTEKSYERFIVGAHEDAVENRPLMDIELPAEAGAEE